MTVTATARAASRRRLPQVTVVWAIGLAWAVAVAAELTGRGRALHHDQLAQGTSAWAALGLFLLAWQLMVAAMMLPSSLPLIRLFGRASANQPRPLRAKAAFLGGYAAVWSGFGAAAFLGDLGVHRLVDRSAWLAARPALLGGAVLVLAGAFQFSKLKDRCLRVCRHPAGYLQRHYRRGTSAAMRLGAGHGVWCVGCCWALMLVAFAAGVANLWWMAALTALMVFEKTGRQGRRGAGRSGSGSWSSGSSCSSVRSPDSHPGRRSVMRRRLAFAAVLAVLAGGVMAASVATAAPPDKASTLRPWGKGPASATAAAEPATMTATPAGATRLVVIAREADFSVIDVAPEGDSPGDQILFTDTLFDQAGRRIGRDQARCTIMFRDDVLCDATFILAGRGQLTIEGATLAFAVTGGTGEFARTRGQLHETFLPTGEFRFVFTLYR